MDFCRTTRGVLGGVGGGGVIGALAVAGPASAQTTDSVDRGNGPGSSRDCCGRRERDPDEPRGRTTFYTTVTSSTGGYQFARIDAGLYRVSVTTPNFRESVIADIKLDAAFDLFRSAD